MGDKLTKAGALESLQANGVKIAGTTGAEELDISEIDVGLKSDYTLQVEELDIAYLR